MSDNTLSIIIPVGRAFPWLHLCLKSLRECESNNNVEIIVVDDCSNGDVRTTANDFGCKYIRHDRKRGAAAARNTGCRASSAEIFVFVDADVQVPKNCLINMMRRISEPGVDAVMGTLTKDSEFENFCSLFRHLDQYYVHQCSLPWTNTLFCSCSAVKASVFKSVGGFDETMLEASVEDIELGYRLTEAGFRIYLDKGIQVRHYKKYSLIELIKTDLFKRAIPWTRLLLTRTASRLDQNVAPRRVCILISAWILVLASVLSLFLPFFLAVVSLLTLLLIVDIDYYRFMVGEKGLFFGLGCYCFNIFRQLYIGVGFFVGLIQVIREHRTLRFPAFWGRQRYDT